MTNTSGRKYKDTSYIPKNFKAGNLIQVRISKLTPLAVISRLITDTFEVTPAGRVVRSSVCDDVTITFPEGAVDRTVTGSMKLVLVPQMIFLFSGFEGIQFMKPVKVKFPHRISTDDVPGHLRVMFQEDTMHPGERWNDVTSDVKLEKKEPGFLELQVQHFSRWRVSSITEPIINWWRSPQQVFLGAFQQNNDPLKLTIACASIFSDIEDDLIGKGYSPLARSTSAEMRHNQIAYIKVKDGLDIQIEENVSVKFIEGAKYREELVYSINRDYFQNHATNKTEHLLLCFYPNIEYVEDERIVKLKISRWRLYPKVPEDSIDINPEPPLNHNQNHYVEPTHLESIPLLHKPESDLVYKMTSSPRGISYIINMKSFSASAQNSGLDERCGSESDVDLLTRLFKALDFIVKPLRDLDKCNLMTELQNISATDFSSFDCLVVFIMSHGKDNYIYTSDGEEVRLKEIFDMFKNSKCKTLQRKPKLFFIQACRGTAADPGAVYSDNPKDQAASKEDDEDKSTDLNPKAYESDPEYCDNLYAYSCFEGHKSYNWKEEGGFFVNCLVHVFRHYSCLEDVLSMLTMVNDEVSRLGCSGGKQIPCSIPTLRRKVFFWPGLSFESS